MKRCVSYLLIKHLFWIKSKILRRSDIYEKYTCNRTKVYWLSWSWMVNSSVKLFEIDQLITCFTHCNCLLYQLCHCFIIYVFSDCPNCASPASDISVHSIPFSVSTPGSLTTSSLYLSSPWLKIWVWVILWMALSTQCYHLCHCRNLKQMHIWTHLPVFLQLRQYVQYNLTIMFISSKYVPCWHQVKYLIHFMAYHCQIC